MKIKPQTIAIGLLLIMTLIIITLIPVLLFSFKENKKLYTLYINDAELNVEVVKTPQAMEKGLSGRDEVGSDGMLFILDQRKTPTFWMKDTYIPLDLIWIDNNTIVDITQNVQPEPDTPEAQLTLYSPDDFVTHVLEVDAGFVEKNNIDIGDSVTIEL